MKRAFLVLISLIALITIKGQNIEFLEFKLRESLPEWILFNTGQVKCEKQLVVTKTLNPYYLESDFNGDSVMDIALNVIEKDTGKKGILIIHGSTFNAFVIGAGNNFAHVGDDLKFLEIWKVYRKKNVRLTTFSENGDILGAKIKPIDNNAIEISKSESPSNIIAWETDKYVWLHTGD
jgi:hypothetical protein